MDDDKIEYGSQDIYFLWYCYKHVDGTVRVKRCINSNYVHEMMKSDFVADFSMPYRARNYIDAEEISKKYFSLDGA